MQCNVPLALARYTSPMDDSTGTIEMSRYPKITINLDHLPQGYHRTHIVHIPILIDIRPKPIDPLIRVPVGEGDGEPSQKAARVSAAEPPPDPEAKPLSVHIPASPPAGPAASPASPAPAASKPPPPQGTVWTSAPPTVADPPVAPSPADGGNLSVPILLTILAKAKATPCAVSKASSLFADLPMGGFGSDVPPGLGDAQDAFDGNADGTQPPWDPSLDAIN